MWPAAFRSPVRLHAGSGQRLMDPICAPGCREAFTEVVVLDHDLEPLLARWLQRLPEVGESGVDTVYMGSIFRTIAQDHHKAGGFRGHGS